MSSSTNGSKPIGDFFLAKRVREEKSRSWIRARSVMYQYLSEIERTNESGDGKGEKERDEPLVRHFEVAPDLLRLLLQPPAGKDQRSNRVVDREADKVLARVLLLERLLEDEKSDLVVDHLRVREEEGEVEA